MLLLIGSENSLTVKQRQRQNWEMSFQRQEESKTPLQLGALWPQEVLPNTVGVNRLSLEVVKSRDPEPFKGLPLHSFGWRGGARAHGRQLCKPKSNAVAGTWKGT